MTRGDYIPPTFIDVPNPQSPPAGAVALDALHINAMVQAIANSSRQVAFDVRDYGADPTSLTDSTAAFQAAINAAGAWQPDAQGFGGGTVYVAPGTYIVSATLTIPSRVTIAGHGRHSRIRLADNTNAHMFTCAATTSGEIRLEKLTLDGNKAHNTAGDAVRFIGTTDAAAQAAVSVVQQTDPNWRLDDVYVVNFAGNGFYLSGRGENRAINCYTWGCNGYGWYIDVFDSVFTACGAGMSGLQGFVITQNNNALIGCKAWYSGSVDATNGDGFLITNNSSRARLTGCEAQDNFGNGFALSSTQNNILSGCVAEANNRLNGTTGLTKAGFFLYSTKFNLIEAVCGDRFTPAYQAYAVQFSSTTQVINNLIRISTDNNMRLSNIDAYSRTVAQNDVLFNSGNGLYKPGGSFTAYDVDLSRGSYFQFALTTDVSINSAFNMSAGQTLTIEFAQDATGGHAITLPAGWKTSWTPSTAANKTNTITLRYNGATFVQIGAAVGM